MSAFLALEDGTVFRGDSVAAEGFADRVYADDAQLVSRKLGKDALVTDPSKAADQAVRMAMEGKVRTISGKTTANSAIGRLRGRR